MHENRGLRMKLSQAPQRSPSPQRPPPLPERDDKKLKIEQERAQQYRDMYENEMQNKKELSQYYEDKLQVMLKDKDVLVNRYEQKIKSMSQQAIKIE